MRLKMFSLFAVLSLLWACSDDTSRHKSAERSDGAAHEEHGPHGGELVELGEHVAHLEVVHDDVAGKLTLYVLDAALKPTQLTSAPVLNLTTDAGPKQVVATALRASASEWVFRDAALKSEPEGARLRVVYDGVTYTPALPHDHSSH